MEIQNIGIGKSVIKKIYSLFLQSKKQKDFVGMDMARKFLQMGYTRSRRYANHKTGRKYDGAVPLEKKGISGAHGRAQLPRQPDEEKAQSAAIFCKAWKKLKADKYYRKRLEEHKEKYRKLKPRFMGDDIGPNPH